MSDLKFDCPHCQQSLEAPEEMCGQKINCPTCNGPIALPDPIPEPQTKTPPPLPDQAPQKPDPILTTKNHPYKISPDSPEGAIDEKLLETYLPDLTISLNEEIFFFLKTVTPARDLPGIPMYNLMVTSRSVQAVAKNFFGNISRHYFPINEKLSASIIKGLLKDSIVFFNGDNCRETYDFVNRLGFLKGNHLPAIVDNIINISTYRAGFFKREFLPTIVEYLHKCKAEIHERIESENLREQELQEEAAKKISIYEKEQRLEKERDLDRAKEQRIEKERELIRAQKQLREQENASILRFLHDPIADKEMEELTWKFLFQKAHDAKLIKNPTLPSATKMLGIFRMKVAKEVCAALYQNHLRLNAQQLHPEIVLKCLLYCFAKGIEAADLMNNNGCTRWNLPEFEIDIPYVPDDAMLDYNRSKAEAISLLFNDETMSSSASVFSAFWEQVMALTAPTMGIPKQILDEIPKQLLDKIGKRQAGFIFFGVFWASALGLALGFERLGMDTDPPTEDEITIREQMLGSDRFTKSRRQSPLSHSE